MFFVGIEPLKVPRAENRETGGMFCCVVLKFQLQYRSRCENRTAQETVNEPALEGALKIIELQCVLRSIADR